MKITSDGAPFTSTFVDNKGDRLALDLTSATITIEPEGPSVLLVVEAPAFEIEVQEQNITYAIGYEEELKAVKRIEFEDGTVWEKPK